MLADLLSRTGKYNQQVKSDFEQALQYNQKALIMRQALYTDNHHDIVTSFNNLGAVYQALGRHQEALKYHQQALDMQKQLAA